MCLFRAHVVRLVVVGGILKLLCVAPTRFSEGTTFNLVLGGPSARDLGSTQTSLPSTIPAVFRVFVEGILHGEQQVMSPRTY